MWKILLLLVLPIAPLAAAQSGSPEGPIGAEAAADVQCLIRAKPLADGVQLEGVVESKSPLSGTYQFEVRKAGSAGTSSSAQSGEFEMGSGEEVIGLVELGIERGASYDAKLALQWRGGEASCTATGPDRI